MSRFYLGTLLNKRDSLPCLISCGTSVKRVYVLLSTNLSFPRLVFHIAEAYVRRAIEYSLMRKVDRTRLFRFERCAAPDPILSRVGDPCVLPAIVCLFVCLFV
jgi:hypothetical protein